MSKTSRFFAAGAALGAALLLTDPSAAQQGPQGQRQEQGERGRRDPQQFLDRRVARLTEGLSLSQQQAAQVRRILEEERTQMQALRPDRGEGRAQGQARRERQARPQDGERRGPPAELVALRQRTEQRIEAVLSESQRAQYRQLREQRGERGDRGQRGERGEGRRDRGERPAART